MERRGRGGGVGIIVIGSSFFEEGVAFWVLALMFVCLIDYRPFDCGIHRCSKACHPVSLSSLHFLASSSEPTTPDPTNPVRPKCPRDPEVVTHCPCGRYALDGSSSADSPSPFPHGTMISLPRTKCTDPIPTCTSICMRPLSVLPSLEGGDGCSLEGEAGGAGEGDREGCTHVCAAKCHLGPCPPCSVMVVRPCRCGGTSRSVRCCDLRGPGAGGVQGSAQKGKERGLESEQETEHAMEKEILCDKPCTALRACGRHRCNRVCCPLASLALSAAKGKGKGKKRGGLLSEGVGGGEVEGEVEDIAGLHECDLICGKLLGCGLHRCEERDHKGVCPPCLRSSFEEVGIVFSLSLSLLFLPN